MTQEPPFKNGFAAACFGKGSHLLGQGMLRDMIGQILGVPVDRLALHYCQAKSVRSLRIPDAKWESCGLFFFHRLPINSLPITRLTEATGQHFGDWTQELQRVVRNDLSDCDELNFHSFPYGNGELVLTTMIGDPITTAVINRLSKALETRYQRACGNT